MVTKNNNGNGLLSVLMHPEYLSYASKTGSLKFEKISFLYAGVFVLNEKLMSNTKVANTK